MARTLTLIKHSRPEKIEGQDSHSWPLSAQGRADTLRLAKLLPREGCVAVVSSDEPKAAETAQILAEALGLPLTTHPGLREHDRSNVAMMKTPEFVSAVANFFRRPNQLVLGQETARQALKRFERAINDLLDAHPEGPDGSPRDLMIVSHGTVLALWLELYCEVDGFTAWRQAGLPSYVSVAWPECRISARMDNLPVAAE